MVAPQLKSCWSIIVGGVTFYHVLVFYFFENTIVLISNEAHKTKKKGREGEEKFDTTHLISAGEEGRTSGKEQGAVSSEQRADGCNNTEQESNTKHEECIKVHT
jgi:hypothetical protein